MDELNKNENAQTSNELEQNNDDKYEARFEEPNINNENEAPNLAQESPETKNTGSIIAIIIIVAIIIIGGLYFWGEKINNATKEDTGATTEEILSTPDEKTESLKKQGTSDSISDIDADLNSTDLDNLDAELQNIDAELNL